MPGGGKQGRQGLEEKKGFGWHRERKKRRGLYSTHEEEEIVLYKKKKDWPCEGKKWGRKKKYLCGTTERFLGSEDLSKKKNC